MPPKSEKAMKREMEVTRKGRSQAANLRDWVVQRESGCELWRTPEHGDAANRTFATNSRGEPKLSTQVKAPGYWPTPVVRDFKGVSRRAKYGVIDYLPDAVNAKVKQYPTPNASNGTGACSHGGGGYNLQTVIKQGGHNDTKTLPQGQLNPDWVEWLMGWPIGWTSLEPITELQWLDWSVDPADGGEVGSWRTPMECDYKNMTYATQDYLSNQVRQWPTPSVTGNHNRKGLSKNSGDGLATQVRQLPTSKAGNPGSGIIPRVTTIKTNRVNRLNAIGNGQVPQCAAMAWQLLTVRITYKINRQLAD